MKARIIATDEIVEVTKREERVGSIIYIVYYATEVGEMFQDSDLDFYVEENVGEEVNFPTKIEKVTIGREEYDKLCKYRNYCSNWAYGIVACSHCGEFNPDGYICANCGKDSHQHH